MATLAQKIKACEKRGCTAEECGECGGAGTTECTCDECDNDHERYCAHCKGTGDCPVLADADDDVAYGPDGAALDDDARVEFRRREWEQFVAEHGVGFTEKEFKSAWRAMFGRDPDGKACDDYLANVHRLALLARVSIDFKTGKWAYVSEGRF